MIHVKFPSSGAYAPCECGVKMAYECAARPEMCGVEKAPVHTPYEFLSEAAKEAAVNTIRELVEESPKDRQVGGTHYSEMKVQPWDFYKSIFSPAGYCDYHVGSVISYLSRHRKKGGLQDLKKSLHHLSELVRYFEQEEEYE